MSNQPQTTTQPPSHPTPLPPRGFTAWNIHLSSLDDSCRDAMRRELWQAIGIQAGDRTHGIEAGHRCFYLSIVCGIEKSESARVDLRCSHPKALMMKEQDKPKLKPVETCPDACAVACGSFIIFATLTVLAPASTHVDFHLATPCSSIFTIW